MQELDGRVAAGGGRASVEGLHALLAERRGQQP